MDLCSVLVHALENLSVLCGTEMLSSGRDIGPSGSIP